MNVTVGGLVWIKKSDLGQSLVKKLRQELTVERKVPKDFNRGGETPTVQLYDETPVHFGIPRQFWAKTSTVPHEYKWNVSFGSPVDFRSNIEHDGPYAEQGKTVNYFVENFSASMNAIRSGVSGTEAPRAIRGSGGILLAPPGFGKTVTALSIIQKLGMTAIVFVNREFLMNQWLEYIGEFLPDAKAGVLYQDRCEIEGSDIVVAMIHSLARDDMTGSRYPRSLYSFPGVVVLDEIHRISSETWSPLPMRFSSVIRLGLSATPRRKDGTERVFFDHVGKIAYRAQTKMAPVGVRISNFHGWVPPHLYSPTANSSIVSSRLAKNRKRNQVIVDEVLQALNAPGGRKVMVLSHRLEQLEAIEEMVERSSKKPDELTIGHYVGEWFGPGETSVLQPGSWDMNEQGRKKAISSLYASISRRKGGKGRIEKKGEYVDPWNGDRTDGKVHVVEVSPDIVKSWVIGSEFSGFSNWVGKDSQEVILEELTDQWIFDLAEKMDVRQDRKRKMVSVEEEELREAARARLILATFQMADEALNIPPIDVIALGTPNGDVHQAIGRGRRFCVPVSEGGKTTPEKCEYFCPWRAGACNGKRPVVVIDIHDQGVPVSERRGMWRLSYYKEEGFRVQSNRM